MTDQLTATEVRQKALEITLTKIVSSVHGVIRFAEAEEIDRLRAETGKVYDATNGRWLSIDDPNGWW